MQRPEETLREVVRQVGVTKRAVKRIVCEFEEAGILLRERSGRRDGYTVAGTCPLRRPLEARRSGRDCWLPGAAERTSLPPPRSGQ